MYLPPYENISPQDGCLAFGLAGATGCLSTQICSDHVFVKITNFDPNEPSTKGKLIGNEASQKPRFGNSEAPIDDMAGW